MSVDDKLKRVVMPVQCDVLTFETWTFDQNKNSTSEDLQINLIIIAPSAPRDMLFSFNPIYPTFNLQKKN